ncbi:MAG: RcpC/CpaB family pilus assembly protein [Acidimicrobiia bacterium]
MHRKLTNRIRTTALDSRVVGGIVLIAVSVVGGLALTRDPAPATQIYVAAVDLDDGHILASGDLKVAELRGDDQVVGGLVRPGPGGLPLGRTLRVGVRAGSAVSLDALGAGAAAGREITIPVTPEHALGGEIRDGDQVDVFATFDKGTDAARTITVSRAATVHGVLRSDGLFGQHAGAITALTLDVQPDSAIAVAFAARNAELDVVRAHGELDGRGRDHFAIEDLQ